MSTNHSPACLELRSKQLKHREAFLNLFPKACQKCNATGLTTFLEHHEFWGEACTEELSESCQECLAQGLCPRCKEKFPPTEDFDVFEELVCPSCSWTYKSPAPPKVISDFDCSCFDEELEKQISENKLYQAQNLLLLTAGGLL